MGNLDAYTKLKAADAIEIAAGNQGMAGMGVGMGVGFGMGNQMGGMMGQAMAPGGGQFNPNSGMQGGAAPAPPPLPSAVQYHYNGPAGQGQKTADQIAQAVAGDRDGNHMVWAAGWPAWKSWKDVAEIVGNVPPPAAAPPPLPDADVVFHYHGPAGQSEKTASEIAQLLADDPDGTHNVWKTGFDGWKAAKDVPEIQAAKSAGPPPPPPMGGPPPI
ncbi:MAG: hypothetical protein ACI9MC_002768 [Kiritimatiellia bacterium]